ncbi:3'-5'-exoribonuclease [Nowakowskiella sp. JEL0078]|nr:3'-5'-exoribonuclease [Nowakowskiella sp. JEL0078]
MRDDQERDFSTQLITSLTPSVRLDLYPKSAIDVFVHVIESDGVAASFAAAVNAATLALADAGIEMLDFVVAASVVSVNINLFYFLLSDNFESFDPKDCTADEEAAQSGSLIMAYMPSLNEITHIVFNGEVGSDLISKAIGQCVDATTRVQEVLSNTLANSMT